MMAAASPGPDTTATASPAATIGIVVMAALLLLGAAVQYNDPDPYRWAALYLAAAGVSLGALWRPAAWKMPVAVAVVALIWAVTLAPVATRVSLPSLFRSWEMMGTDMEEGREFFGLLLIAAWASYLAFRGRKISALRGHGEELQR